MEIDLELSPKMFYYDFDFYEGMVQLTYPFEFKENFYIDIWGLSLSIGNENIKNQLSEETINELSKNKNIEELFNGKYGSLFINGISRMYFSEVVGLNFSLELLEGDNAKRIKNNKNEKVILKYERGEKIEDDTIKVFNFPDATVFFPFSWMEGKVYSKKNVKLIINLDNSMLMTDYITNAESIYEKFKSNFELKI